MQKTVSPFSLQAALQYLSRLLLVATYLFICLGFTASSVRAPVPDEGVWVLQKTIDNVEFYHMLANCNGKKVVLLKFNNKNTHNVKVAWKEVFTTQYQREVEGLNGKKQLIIGPGEYAANCQENKIKELLILPVQVQPTYMVQIMDFQFKDIEVSHAF